MLEVHRGACKPNTTIRRTTLTGFALAMLLLAQASAVAPDAEVRALTTIVLDKEMSAPNQIDSFGDSPINRPMPKPTVKCRRQQHCV